MCGLKQARTINAQRSAVQPCTLDAVSALATTLRESTYAPMSVDLSFNSSRHTNSSGGATLELMHQVLGADPSSPKYRHSYCGSEPTYKPSRSQHIDAATSPRFRIPCTLRSNDRLW